MKKHYPIIIEQDKDGVFIVQCPLFKGCRSYGYNIDEAIKNIKEAIEVCIEDDDFMDQYTKAFNEKRIKELRNVI